MRKILLVLVLMTIIILPISGCFAELFADKQVTGAHGETSGVIGIRATTTPRNGN